MLPLGGGGCCSLHKLHTALPFTSSHSDPEYEDNLKYFVEKGVRPDDGCDYLVVVQEVGAGVRELLLLCWFWLEGTMSCGLAGCCVYTSVAAVQAVAGSCALHTHCCCCCNRCGNGAETGSHWLAPVGLQGKGVLESHLPEMPANVHTVHHANECFDWGTFGWVRCGRR